MLNVMVLISLIAKSITESHQHVIRSPLFQIRSRDKYFLFSCGHVTIRGFVRPSLSTIYEVGKRAFWKLFVYVSVLGGGWVGCWV